MVQTIHLGDMQRMYVIEKRLGSEFRGFGIRLCANMASELFQPRKRYFPLRREQDGSRR